MIDWLGFHELGVSIFPVRYGDKKPAVPWKRYQRKQATRKEVTQWSRGKFNLGIVTGSLSGLVVLDLDSEEAIDEAIKRGLPKTPIVQTAKGAHVYFRHPGGMIGNKASFLPGMDLRGDGGYVVGPGSRHPSGKVYDWIVSPTEADLADMPDWLLKAVTQPDMTKGNGEDAGLAPGNAVAVIGCELAKLRVAPEGRRNDQLNHSAYTLGRLDAGNQINGDMAYDALFCAAIDIGLERQEVERTIESGWAAGLNEPLILEGAEALAITATPYPWPDARDIPQRPWLYGRWLLRGVVTAIIAPGGVGKSSFMAGTALVLASGREILGKDVWEGPRRVWLWNLEDDQNELARQISAFAKHHGIEPRQCAQRLFVNSAMDGAELCTAVEDHGGFRLISPVYEAIIAELARCRIDVLIIDPFVSSHRIDENANFKVDAVIKQWTRVAKEANCAIVLVHHTRKLAGQKVDAEASRGAGAMTNAARTVLVLNRMTADEARQFGIDGDDERRRYFSVSDDKHNRAPPEKAEWYRMVSVPLGNGGPEGGDSVGVIERWTPPDPHEGVDNDTLRQVQTAVSEGEWREDAQAKAWVGHAVAKVLGLNPVDPADKRRLKFLIKHWLEWDVLRAVEKPDAARRKRRFVVPGELIE